MTISFIIPTIHRPSLQTALASIEQRSGDEILVMSQPEPRQGCYGNIERQMGVDRATCDYLAFLDDDNVYVAGHRAIMEHAMDAAPGNPTLFRIRYPSGREIWTRKHVKSGNVDTQMILVPNRKELLQPWRANKRVADFHFINCWHWRATVDVNWSTDVIAHMSKEDDRYAKTLK